MTALAIVLGVLPFLIGAFVLIIDGAKASLIAFGTVFVVVVVVVSLALALWGLSYVLGA